MPKPKNPIPQGKRLVYMDEDLFNRIDLMHLDPLTMQPKKGAFSAYIKRLVKEDFERRRRAYLEKPQ